MVEEQKQTERNCMGIAYRVEFRVSSQSTASDEMGKHRRRQHRTKPSFKNKTITIIEKREPGRRGKKNISIVYPIPKKKERTRKNCQRYM